MRYIKIIGVLEYCLPVNCKLHKQLVEKFIHLTNLGNIKTGIKLLIYYIYFS